METENTTKKMEFIEPEITIINLTGMPITADSSVCCSFRGMVGYDS